MKMFLKNNFQVFLIKKSCLLSKLGMFNSSMYNSSKIGAVKVFLSKNFDFLLILTKRTYKDNMFGSFCTYWIEIKINLEIWPTLTRLFENLYRSYRIRVLK